MTDTRERLEGALARIEAALNLSDADAERIGFAKGEIMLPVDIAERLIAPAEAGQR